MARLPVLLALLPLAACTTAERDFHRTVSADAISRVFATVERGSFDYLGGSETAFDIQGVSSGHGAGDQAACKRRNGNDWEIRTDPGTLIIEATSTYKRAEVDLDVLGPSQLDLDVLVDRGSAHFEAVEGVHVVTASRITSRQLIGDVDLLARSGGMDVEIWPYQDGVVLLQSQAGDVTLWLPFGGDYDLEVIGDPEYPMFITDLGFYAGYEEPGYVSGIVGNGSVRVQVFVNGGSFELLESF